MALTFDAEPSATAAMPRDAATVLALRDTHAGPEVFMVRRDSRMGFLGGAHVFPGGALDEADSGDALHCRTTGFEAVGTLSRLHADAGRAKGLLLAAVRELFEESGILLARGEDGDWVDLDEEGPRARRLKAARAELSRHEGDFSATVVAENLTIDVSGLRLFAHWITPDREKKRFDTRFFLARAPERQSARHCEVESSAGEWITPSAALARYFAREIELVPPTIASLESLAGFGSVSFALAAFTLADLPCVVPTILPKIILGEQIVILYPGDADYESGDAKPPAGRTVNRLEFRDGLWRRP